MGKPIMQMTENELRDWVNGVVEEKLLELLQDPDEGLQLRASVRHQLESQRRDVESGERGRPLTDVIEELGLA